MYFIYKQYSKKERYSQFLRKLMSRNFPPKAKPAYFYKFRKIKLKVKSIPANQVKKLFKTKLRKYCQCSCDFQDESRVTKLQQIDACYDTKK